MRKRGRSDIASLLTRDEAALLEAALFEGEAAQAAWRRWFAACGSDLSGREALIGEPRARVLAALRLAPLVAKNLGRHGEVPRELAGVASHEHRRARLHALGLVARAAELIAVMSAHGVPVIVLKGVSLATRYYRDFGLRTMSDVDVLVPPEAVPEALAVLHQRGFAPTEAIPADAWPPTATTVNLASRAIVHGVGFRDPRGLELDLHWAALPTNCARTCDARFWERKVPLTLAGSPLAFALCPEHELVHAIVHGLRWNETPSYRWVADAMTVLAATSIDWDEVEREARSRRVSMTVALGLTLLSERFAAAVPRATIDALWEAIGPVDRLRHAHLVHPWDRKKPPTLIAMDLWRFVDGLPVDEAMRVAARYAAFRVNPSGDWHAFPRELLRKLARIG